MGMRKYLMNAKLTHVRQICFDRVLELEFEGTDAIGSFTNLTLNIEVMGRYSNITLYDTATKVILDALKHITPSANSTRTILPKESFTYAPSHKLDPMDFDLEEAMQIGAFQLQKGKDALLMSIFNGLGLSSSKEIAARLWPQGELESAEDLKGFLQKTKTFFSHLDEHIDCALYTNEEGKRVDLCALSIEQYAAYERLAFASPSEMVEEYYKLATEQRRLGTNYDHILKAIKTKLEKEKRNLSIRQKELKRSEDYEIYNTKGQLLLCHLHMIKKGDKSIVVQNLLSEENEPMEIALSPKLTPNQNAQSYFKKFHKAKRAEQFLTRFIEETKQNITFLEEMLSGFYMCETEQDMADIQKLLIAKGLLKKNVKKITSPRNEKTLDYLVYFTSTGQRVLVGKNSAGNERLSLRKANKEHWWFHVKDHGGSHVILESKDDPKEEEIRECALLAAYYSAQREEKNVHIDYTRVKNLKRHPALIPGLVTYTGNKTVTVTPAENDIFLLKEKANEQQNKKDR